MIFTAKLNRQSTVWIMWQKHNRVSGLIGGVEFRKSPNGDYVTDTLGAAQIDILRTHGEVLLEMHGLQIEECAHPERIAQLHVASEEYAEADTMAPAYVQRARRGRPPRVRDE